MYTKQEISKQKQAFWTAFGRYMKPVLSADGEEISWLNYKTGNKHVLFKMEADSQQAQIAIVLYHPDTERQQLYYDRFVQLKGIFYETVGENDWVWVRDSTDEYGKVIGVIQKTLMGVNIFKNEDWPAIISFLKPRIIALDAFWGMVRYQFSNV
ncbi:MAG TPA: DUF4268 domain-containing protein [Puia sp.]|jgi:hypothetical protein